MSDLKRTLLFERHVASDARMVPFAGWEMPVQYSGIRDEHAAVRSAAGLFDVSHMGQIEFTGTAGLSALDRLTTNNPTNLEAGRCHYAFYLNESGGVVDDTMIYRVSQDRLLSVVNASNLDKVWGHIGRHLSEAEKGCVENTSDTWSLLALQGPRFTDVLGALDPSNTFSILPFHHIQHAELCGREVLVAASGYTGENGIEIFTRDGADVLWDALLDLDGGPLPCGLGARDTLRLEASLALYGHELDDDTSPIEAGLGFGVAKTGDFIGAEVIRRQRRDGTERRLVSIVVDDKMIPRQGSGVLSASGEKIGTVTSGTMAPWLKKPIAMAYVKSGYHTIGTQLLVDVRGRNGRAHVVRRPFYKRPER